MAATLENI
jgi:septation ring formation regulator EzrA